MTQLSQMSDDQSVTVAQFPTYTPNIRLCNNTKIST